MDIQTFTSYENSSSKAYLAYDMRSSLGVVLDPGPFGDQILAFARERKISIGFFILSEVTFEKAYSISQLKLETRAKFYSFQSDLLELRKLPRWADERNVCGIKIPQVDHFLDGADTVDFHGFCAYVWTENNYHEYGFGKLRLPEK